MVPTKYISSPDRSLCKGSHPLRETASGDFTRLSYMQSIGSNNGDIKFVQLEEPPAVRPDMTDRERRYFNGLDFMTKLSGWTRR